MRPRNLFCQPCRGGSYVANHWDGTPSGVRQPCPPCPVVALRLESPWSPLGFFSSQSPVHSRDPGSLLHPARTAASPAQRGEWGAAGLAGGWGAGGPWPQGLSSHVPPPCSPVFTPSASAAPPPPCVPGLLPGLLPQSASAREPSGGQPSAGLGAGRQRGREAQGRCLAWRSLGDRRGLQPQVVKSCPQGWHQGIRHSELERA